MRSAPASRVVSLGMSADDPLAVAVSEWQRKHRIADGDPMIAALEFVRIYVRHAREVDATVGVLLHANHESRWWRFHLFTRLFVPTTSYRPIEKFREEAAALLPKADANKLIKFCQSASAPRVSFETTERKAA